MDIIWLLVGTGFFIGASICVHGMSRLHPEG